MIIGKINLDTEKSSPLWNTDIENLKELLYDYRMERRHVVLECKECGQLLAPFIALCGPRSCGWKKDKDKQWICHQCYYHSGGWFLGDEPDRIEFRKDVIRRNEETRKRISFYRITHPWVKIRYQ